MNRAGGTDVGGWVELGRTTLGGASSTVSVSSLSDKRYYMTLLSYPTAVSDVMPDWRLNGDTGSNYAVRYSGNGGADSTYSSYTYARGGFGTTTNKFSSLSVGYFANYASKEKLGISHFVNQSTAGTANAPQRSETVGKWANTSNAINQITAGNNIFGNNYPSGSELIVLGYDPADTHTNNFWEELASVEASGSSSTLDTGTITAKKYLWVQCYAQSSDTDFMRIYFNNDPNNNATRHSDNGGADGTSTYQNQARVTDNSTNTPRFFNMFMINTASNEKLGIYTTLDRMTAGAGSAPNRREAVIKYAQTSSQITRITFDQENGYNFNSNSILKVWGAD